MTPSVTPTPEPLAFTPFGWHHLIVLLVCGAVAGVVIAIARRARASGGELRIRRAWAWTTFSVAMLVVVYWMWPSRFDPAESWPLQLCDIAALLTPFFMLSNRRWPRTLMFFWGIGLSSQGFITPVLDLGPGDPFYWLFWMQHLGVVGGGIYVAAVTRYRPGWRDLALAWAVTVALGLTMVPFDQAFHVNYMYVANTLPEAPTVLDALGPWPMRLVWLAGLIAVAFGLTWGGEELVRLVVKSGKGTGDPGSL